MSAALIDNLTDAILASFNEMEEVKSCELDPDDLRGLELPAVLLKENYVELAPDDGTDRLGVEVTYLAQVIVRRTAKTAERDARTLALKLMQNIKDNEVRGLQNISLPTILHAEPDPFKEEGGGKNQGLVTWAVEWSHVVYIGNDIWDE